MLKDGVNSTEGDMIGAGGLAARREAQKRAKLKGASHTVNDEAETEIRR